MIISGNKIAREIQQELKDAKQMGESLATLHIFVVGENPVIESFVGKKRSYAEALGVAFIEHRFAEEVTQEEFIEQVEKISKMTQGTPGPFGIVVQLPLPSHIDTQEVLDSVPVEYDVDGLSTGTHFLPPVAGAVREMLTRKNIVVMGKKALVVGRGKLVGEPVAKMLRELGAVVSIADKSTTPDELAQMCQESDIVVSGAGVPSLITKDMVKSGSALFDAGTSTQGFTVVGDIARDCKGVAGWFSRTPGGIGPVTVAVLFKNLITNSVMTK